MRTKLSMSGLLLGVLASAALLPGQQNAVVPVPQTGGQNPVPFPGTQSPQNQNPTGGVGTPGLWGGNNLNGNIPGNSQSGFIQPLQPIQSNLPGQLLQGASPQGGGQGGLDEFSSIWSRPSAPQFSGFPVFPARLPGYGNYPLPAGGQVGDPSGQTSLIGPLPPAEPEPAGWPSWVRTQAKRPIPFAVDQGLLISQEGRVWHRATGDEPFVPLFFHDKFRSLPVGATAESRGTASFEVLLERSTRIQARGVTTLTPTKLDAETVHVKIDKLSWLRLTCSARKNVFTLPDGSNIEMTASQPAPVAGLVGLFGMPALPEPLSPPLVEIRRLDEPGWYGQRATLTNLGGADIVWNHAFGRTVIAPAHRVTLFLTPPTESTQAGLAPGGTQLEHRGDHVTCRSVRDTELRWCGARFELPKGTSVTLESLGGEFAQPTQPRPGSPLPKPVGSESAAGG